MRRLLLCSILFVSACNSNSEKLALLEKQNRELLDLQEKCATQARAEFNAEGWEKYQFATLTNHYNQKLNKCFTEVSSTDTRTAGDGTVHKSVFVIDAFEGKSYGQYSWHSDKVPPLMCKVTSLFGEEAFCHSEEEFKTAMMQYME
jgi:hypothetical protein